MACAQLEIAVMAGARGVRTIDSNSARDVPINSSARLMVEQRTEFLQGLGSNLAGKGNLEI